MAVPIQNPKKAAILADLKRLLQCPGEGATLQRFLFGLSALDNHLPQDGLTVAALHEFLPRSAGDGIAAFGFALVLMARVAQAGPMLIILSPRGTALGRIYGHGLRTMGIDPSRVLLIEAGSEIEAGWAVEEALKSKAPAGVMVLGMEPDFQTLRRLHLAAEKAGLPLFLLRPGIDAKWSAGASRWRIGSAKAARDRFGLLTRWRWRVA